MKRLNKIFILSVIFVLITASVSSCSEVKLAEKPKAEISREVFPLERDDVKLHLECMKSGRYGEPLLLVHGVTFSSHEFDVNYKDYSVARFFARRGFNVWLLDIAGFGQSGEVEDGFTPDSDYAAEDILAAANLILEHEGRKSLDVLGWSWGAVTAGRFAAENPELVRRLVLYAPIVAGLGDEDVEEDFHHNTWGTAVSDFQRNKDKSINYDITEPEVVSTYVANCWHYDRDSSPNGGRKDLLVAPSERLIPTEDIEVPVLIIAGSKDSYVSPELCREAFKTLKNKASRLEIVDGAGHIMMIEKPYYKTFRQKVLEFLRAN